MWNNISAQSFEYVFAIMHTYVTYYVFSKVVALTLRNK